MDFRTNYERMYSCETCRYFCADFLDPFVGECYRNQRPTETNVFRPACHHYEGDCEAPEYFPPLLKNDRVCVNATTGEVFRNEESDRAERKFQEVMAWNNYDVLMGVKLSADQEKQLAHLDRLKDHIAKAQRPEVASGLQVERIDWEKIPEATEEEQKARVAESLATTADPSQSNEKE